MSWTEQEERDTLAELAKYPAKAMWRGLRMAQAEKALAKRKEKEEAEMAKKVVAGGAARALRWMARAHVAGSLGMVFWFFAMGFMLIQLICAPFAVPGPVVVIPIERRVNLADNSGTAEYVKSAAEYSLHPKKQFAEGIEELTMVARFQMQAQTQEARDELAFCERAGFCAESPLRGESLSLTQEMPLAGLWGKTLRHPASAAAVALGAPASVRVWGLFSVVISLLVSAIAGALAVWFLAAREWDWITFSTQDARERWAADVKTWCEKGLPEFERREMLKAVKKGRLARASGSGIESETASNGALAAPRKPSRL